MHVNVKNLLPCGDAIGQKQVNALTTYIRISHCLGQPMGYVEHPHTCLYIQMMQVSGMGYGYDPQMIWIYRADVHEGDNSVIAVNHAGWRFARDYLTEYAIAE